MYPTPSFFSILFILLSSFSLLPTLALPPPYARDASTSLRLSQRWIAAHRLEEWTDKGYHKKYRRNPILERQQEGEGVKMIQVTESSIDIPSSLGTMTEKCLTLVLDPSQSFCTTFLNGQNIGSDSGLGAVAAGTPDPISNATTRGGVQRVADQTTTPSSSAGPVSSGTVSLTTRSSSATESTSALALSSTSTSFANTTTTASSTNSTTSTSGPGGVSISTSASNGSSAASSSISIDVVVNAATSSTTPTTVSLTSSPSSSVLGSDAPTLSSTPTITSSAAADGIAISTSSTVLVPSSAPNEPGTSLSIDTASIVVVNDPTSSGQAATAAAAEASTSTTPIPGQKLQVLPIGLGIFGGLVVLTLLVVGYVLYERRKYKLQFRRRKDEEKATFASRGAEMGYTT